MFLSQVTDGESMEAVSEPGFSADVGEPQLVHTASQQLSEHGEEDTFVAAQKEIEIKEIEHKETLSTEETVSTVMVHSVGSNSTSETEKEEGSQVKTEEEFELSSEENPAEPDMSKDTNMHNTVEKITNLNMETDMDTTKDKGTQEGSPGSKSRVPKAEDLDEMMDIGTVDQGEQEAQMKEEQENHLMEEDCSHSPAIFHTGKVKQSTLFITVFCFMTQTFQW